MVNGYFINYGSARTTRLVLYGSLFVSTLLSIALLVYDIFSHVELRLRTILSFLSIIYLLGALYLLKKLRTRIVSWMLISLYTLVSVSILFYWGVTSATSVLVASFVIILSGLLLGSRSILPVSITVALLIAITYFVHQFTPFSQLHGDDQVSATDILSCLTILAIFSHVTWIYGSQTERYIRQVKRAEKTIRTQKENLAAELEKESARLRQSQLNDTRQLYKFATLGQDVIATLHELSNHLSILNMDINDLRQQNRQSKAIKSVETSIEQMNFMVRQARKRINSFDDTQQFKVSMVLKQIIKDQSEKYALLPKTFRLIVAPDSAVELTGDPLALTQIMTILTSNAIEACQNIKNPQIILSVQRQQDTLYVSVIDNGSGINDTLRSTIFSPTVSTKPNGLGVGLYIARHLLKAHFQGSVKLKHTSSQQRGAHFLVTLPLK